MRYKAGKTNINDPCIGSSEWDKAEEGKISMQRWTEFYQPVSTTFKLLRCPDGISVLMHTDEKNLRSECKEQNGNVYLDSCMEFFFKPDPWDVNYINFELNPDKILCMEIGAERYGRKQLDTDRAIFNIESVTDANGWTLKFYIPDSFLLEHFNKIHTICRGNFYKCGGFNNHYITWSEVEVENPDFHLADFFGQIEF